MSRQNTIYNYNKSQQSQPNLERTLPWKAPPQAVKMNMNQATQDPTKQFIGGYYASLNFGKHKGLTFFDVANRGDFGYLEWLDKSKVVKLHPSCVDYLKSALQTKDDKLAMWKENIEENPDERTRQIYYAADVTDEKGDSSTIFSPTFQKMECCKCKRWKNQEVVRVKSKTCTACEMADRDNIRRYE